MWSRPRTRCFQAALAAALVLTACGAERTADVPGGADEPDLDAAVDLVLPVPPGASRESWFEPLVGRTVHIPVELVVADLHGLERSGEILLQAGSRPIQFTNVHRPDVNGYRDHAAEFERGTILLDDGSFDAWVKPVRYYRATVSGAPIRAGDRITGLTGILRHAASTPGGDDRDYRIEPTVEPEFVRPAAAASLPPPGGGVLRVMAANALNLFSTPRAGGTRCGPNLLACRGADTLAEYDRQLAKLAATVDRSNAHVVGLMEVENDEGRTLTDLVAAVSARRGSEWRHVETGIVGGDAIRVALIYDTAAVAPVGAHRVLSAHIDPAFVDDRNRPSLAQTFRAAGGEVLTVAVNHLKSKGSDCDDLGDPDIGDGQGNCNLTRTRAAEVLGRWLKQDPTGSGDPDVLIVGDLNAYLEEDPVRVLEDAGFVNLVERFEGTPAYTYLYRGRIGVLDHALASPALAAKVTATRIWHINADEAALRDYNLDNDRDPALFDAEQPYRSSDHDPVIVDVGAVH